MSLKIAMVGPRMAGKTKICNHLFGMSVPAEAKYEPTAGVRILTMEREIKVRGEGQSVKLELWDCSGDQKYENCWPAIMKDLNGIIVCFDPTSKSQANDVRIWCEWFCRNASLQNGQCTIFAHGNLTTLHKPLSVRAGNRIVVVPIVNANTGIKQPLKTEADETPVERVPTSAETEFLNFVATCLPLASLSKDGPGPASPSPSNRSMNAGGGSAGGAGGDDLVSP